MILQQNHNHTALLIQKFYNSSHIFKHIHFQTPIDLSSRFINIYIYIYENPLVHEDHRQITQISKILGIRPRGQANKNTLLSGTIGRQLQVGQRVSRVSTRQK